MIMENPIGKLCDEIRRLNNLIAALEEDDATVDEGLQYYLEGYWNLCTFSRRRTRRFPLHRPSFAQSVIAK
jgi:hypothetical protein